MILLFALDRTSAAQLRAALSLKRERSSGPIERYRGELAGQSALLVPLSDRETEAAAGYLYGRARAELPPSEPLFTVAALSRPSLASQPSSSENTDAHGIADADSQAWLYDKIRDSGSGQDTYPDIVINPGFPQYALGIEELPPAQAKALRGFLSPARLLLTPHTYAVLGLAEGGKLSAETRRLLEELARTHAALHEEYGEPVGDAEQELLERTAASLSLTQAQRDRLRYEAAARAIRDRAFPRAILQECIEASDRRDRKSRFNELTNRLRSEC